MGLTGYALLWLAPPQPAVFIALLVLAGFGSGAAYIGFWSMIPDTVEYSEWRSGVRAEGAVFGVVSFIQKAGLGFAAAALGEFLARIGFVANVPQSVQTLADMKVVMLAVPALCAGGAAAVIAFYPLDGRLHGRLLKALGRRKGEVQPGTG